MPDKKKRILGPQNRYRQSKSKRGYDRHWESVRREYLSRHPRCSEMGCFRFAVEVDHVQSIRSGGAKYDFANLRGYCKSCHSKKTVRCDGGFGRGKA